MDFDETYLNQSANKWPRPAGIEPEFVVWHETASPNPDNPHGTLSYNLAARVASSYNYLIARDGTTFHYVDERVWISYHAGLHSAARGYVEWGVNLHSIGVEVDGRNDGTPITSQQRDAIIRLMHYFKEEYGIPLDRNYHLAHKEVAPGYKSDPRGMSVALAVQLAQQAAGTVPTPKPVPVDGLAVVAPSRISPALFVQELQTGKSPAAPFAAELYGIIASYGLDPAVALAFFRHESKYGTLGVCKDYDTCSWGNVRTPVDAARVLGIVQVPGKGSYVKYGTWQDGLRDWCERIISWYIREWGLTTVEAIIPKYAPSKDNNNVEAYIASVRSRVAAWQAQLPAPTPPAEPARVEVHPEFMEAWERSGGIWRPEQLTPGYPIEPAEQLDGHLVQRFERGVARLNDAGDVEWLLLSEVDEEEI